MGMYAIAYVGSIVGIANLVESGIPVFTAQFSAIRWHP